MTAIAVRAPSQADVPAMARVVVTSWRETYRGLMRDDVLDDPGMLAWRERFWTAALTEPRYAANRVAVAEAATPGSDREVVGVAMSGPPLDDAPPAPLQLYVLYVLAEHHGSGAGAGLLDAVVPAGVPAYLWVADPNPRAQAFYRKHGFVPDGVTQVDDGVPEIRMVRG